MGKTSKMMRFELRCLFRVIDTVFGIFGSLIRIIHSLLR